MNESYKFNKIEKDGQININFDEGELAPSGKDPLHKSESISLEDNQDLKHDFVKNKEEEEEYIELSSEDLEKLKKEDPFEYSLIMRQIGVKDDGKKEGEIYLTNIIKELNKKYIHINLKIEDIKYDGKNFTVGEELMTQKELESYAWNLNQKVMDELYSGESDNSAMYNNPFSKYKRGLGGIPPFDHFK